MSEMPIPSDSKTNRVANKMLKAAFKSLRRLDNEDDDTQQRKIILDALTDMWKILNKADAEFNAQHKGSFGRSYMIDVDHVLCSAMWAVIVGVPNYGELQDVHWYSKGGLMLRNLLCVVVDVENVSDIGAHTADGELFGFWKPNGADIIAKKLNDWLARRNSRKDTP